LQVGGFLQRIDYVRKHAFAAMCILKDNKAGTFPIRGLFLFRGQDIPPIMKEECYDIDLYNWTKVDINDPVSNALFAPSALHFDPAGLVTAVYYPPPSLDNKWTCMSFAVAMSIDAGWNWANARAEWRYALVGDTGHGYRAVAKLS